MRILGQSSGGVGLEGRSGHVASVLRRGLGRRGEGEQRRREGLAKVDSWSKYVDPLRDFLLGWELGGRTEERWQVAEPDAGRGGTIESSTLVAGGGRGVKAAV